MSSLRSTVMLACLVLLGTPFVMSSPTYELINGTEVVWEKPQTPKGILFVAHGCSHGAVDFWPKSTACPTCIGIQKGITICGGGRSRCWHIFNHHQSQSQKVKAPPTDTPRVINVLQTLRKREAMEELPLYSLGASSGGAFVLFLAMVEQMSGVCSQIMAISPRMLGLHFNRTVKGPLGLPVGSSSPSYPPTMFVHMPRDEGTATGVKACMKVLQEQAVPVKEVTVGPRPITPVLFSDRIQGLDPAASRDIYEALRSAGLLDEQGYLKDDPRWTSWREALGNAQSLQALDLRADFSPVSELLNLAHAGHEIVSDTTDEMLDWFESLGSTASTS